MQVVRYSEWEARVPLHERQDPLWRVEAYRLARFCAHESGEWVDRIRRRPLGFKTACQLHDAIWSVPANIAEGYGRSSPVDRLRFYDYALGSLRESVVWYAGGSQLIDAPIPEETLGRVASVRRLLLTMISSHAKLAFRHRALGTSPGP